jgi:hypothetical protein
MLRPLLFIGSFFIAAPAHAAMRPEQNVMIQRQMLKLTPETRIEERCDARANGLIGREHPDKKPDKTIAYAFGDVTITDRTVHAPYAVFRSRGEWFHLSYSCVTSNDGLDIQAFSYSVGDKVPRALWAEHDLYP